MSTSRLSSRPLKAKGPSTGPDMIKVIAENVEAVSLDQLLRRNPLAQPMTDGELEGLIRSERAARTSIEVKAEKARLRKKGHVDEEDNAKNEDA